MQTASLKTSFRAEGHGISGLPVTPLDPASVRRRQNKLVINYDHVRGIDHPLAVSSPELINGIVFASQALCNMMNFLKGAQFHDKEIWAETRSRCLVRELGRGV